MEDLIGNILSEKGLTISVAESCTGGIIGGLITDEPGSSRYFQGGIISYSDESKVNILNVSSGTITEHGAVSERTVREMAEGVKNLFNSHIGLAVTGIAGPEGGSKEKPVGTVFIGLAVEGEIFAFRYHFRGTREQIRRKTAERALDCVKRYLYGDPFLPGL
jgi:nicotinamide-nucleotide amidase